MHFNQEDGTKFFLIFAIAFVMYARRSAGSSSCGGKFSTRMDQDVFSKHRLRSRVIESQPISMPLECYVKCMKNCRCVSYNICNGGKLCELNSEKKEHNISLYEANDDCDYHEYEFSKQHPGACMDQCCSTSQPCLNMGRCEATCMKNDRRFRCICTEQLNGDRCENVPRSCAHYYDSTNLTPGLRLIYADGIPFHVFCFFDEWSAMTLVMSYSRDNKALFKKPLTTDYSVSEDSHNWEKYRLSRARMFSVLNGALEWKITCSYQLQGMQDQDYLKVSTADNPLTAESGCIQVTKIRIRGQGCDYCPVFLNQKGCVWHVIHTNQNGCDHVPGYVNVVPVTSCKVIYFGNYADCFDEQFSCTSSGDATTQ